MKRAPLPNSVMGHVKDTPHVREVEKKYGYPLIGYSARWHDQFRVYVWDNGQWRGVYPLKKDDLSIYTTGVLLE